MVEADFPRGRGTNLRLTAQIVQTEKLVEFSVGRVCPEWRSVSAVTRWSADGKFSAKGIVNTHK